jgi:tetratricopeptide (TPR) repeat protein
VTNRTCEECGGPNSATAAFCRHCGNRIAVDTVPNTAPSPTAAPEGGAALSYANLLRMRGQWSEAADHCAAVIRGDPSNATAHSLLGDIYQDQDRLEEARHWYRQALELNPAGSGDKAKLARIDEALEARTRKAEYEAVIQSRSQPITRPLEIREGIQRVMAIAGAVACAVILVMATLVTVSDPHSAGAESTESPSVNVFRPQQLITETPKERELLRRLSGLRGEGKGQLIRIALDPGARVARARIYLDLRGSPEEPHSALMREGYRIAKAIQLNEASVQAIHLEIVGPATSNYGGETDLLFLGTLNRGDLVVDPKRLTPSELQGYFNAVAPPFWGADPAH